MVIPPVFVGYNKFTAIFAFCQVIFAKPKKAEISPFWIFIKPT